MAAILRPRACTCYFREQPKNVGCTKNTFDDKFPCYWPHRHAIFFTDDRKSSFVNRVSFLILISSVNIFWGGGVSFTFLKMCVDVRLSILDFSNDGCEINHFWKNGLVFLLIVKMCQLRKDFDVVYRCNGLVRSQDFSIERAGKGSVPWRKLGTPSNRWGPLLHNLNTPTPLTTYLDWFLVILDTLFLLQTQALIRSICCCMF